MTNAHATEALWVEFSDALLGYLRRVTPDEATAQDILQEVFLRVHTNVGRQAPEARLGPWVFRIAKNLVVDHHRRRGAPSVPFDLVQDIVPTETNEPAPHVALERALGTWLLGRIEHLPAHYREAVRLAEVDGVEQKQIAARLELPYSTVKSRVQRGRAKLARDLAQCCDVDRDRRGRVLEVRRRCEC